MLKGISDKLIFAGRQILCVNKSPTALRNLDPLPIRNGIDWHRLLIGTQYRR